MSSSNHRKKRAYLRAAIVGLIGVCVTVGLTYLIERLQYDRYIKSQSTIARDYARALENELEAKMRALSPIVNQVAFEQEKPNRAQVMERLRELEPLLSSMTSYEGFRYMTWTPIWAGRKSQSHNDIIATQDWHRTNTIAFLTSNAGKWQSLVSKPVRNETTLFGVDVVSSKGAAYLVVGQPFFQNFNLTGSHHVNERFPLGFMLSWMDLGHLMRKGWDGNRRPEYLLYLVFDKSPSEKYYLAYQSGLVDIVPQSKLHANYGNGVSLDFSLAGETMTLKVVSLKEGPMGLLGQLHWFVLVAGLFSTLLWSLLSLRLSVQKHAVVEREVDYDDFNEKLASEAAQRRSIENILQMHEARWHFVVDNLPVTLFAVDSAGMFTLGEGKGLAALGLEAGSVEGNSIFEVFVNQPDLINTMRECLAGEERHEILEINRHWMDMRFTPVILPNGKYEGMICVATDVTGEHHVRDRLDKVNLHLRGLMDNVPTGVAFVREGVVQWCSRRLEEMFCFEREGLQGRSPEILYNDSDTFEHIERNAREKLLRREAFEFQCMFRRQDKSRFKGQITGRLVDSENTKAGTMWVIQDLTRLIEEQKEKRLSQTVYENVVEGVMVCNAEREIIFVNKAFSSITGYPEKEILGLRPSVLSSGRHDPGFYANMYAGMEKNGEWEGEIWNRRKNGENYLQWLNISVLKDDNGNVEEYVAVFNDITKHRQTQEQLTYQANYDMLTGLPNKLLLADRFAQAAAQSDRDGEAFSLVYLDLDNFKYLNESLGHDAGDVVLKEMAKRLQETLRSVDTVARIGGDEFVVILVGAGDEESAARAIGNLSMVLSEPMKIPERDDDIMLSASCGIAVYPADGTSFTELNRKADAALHYAKETERGLFKFYTEDMNERARERLDLEYRLRRAIENEEFILHYQPKVCAQQGAIRGAEALIRWIDPELGVIGPDKFIPIAEETGLIVPIGEWVFETACKQIQTWTKKGLEVSNIAVNLSGRQFTKPDLAHDFIAIMMKYDVQPSQIEIEITESFMASGESNAVEALRMLSKNGVLLSVDDFGTGYSSLGYLQRFPLDIMKIDRSFIKNIGDETEEVSSKLAKAVIAIGKSMGLRIVGEGVENETQLNFLQENDCDLVQGYYYSRPLPADDFEELLRDGLNL